jgi:hypothetical protein
VRTDSDRGWGLFCVQPSKAAFRRLSSAFDGMPSLVGPLYVDDERAEVIVFGLGRPSDASEIVAEAIDAHGSYLAAR